MGSEGGHLCVVPGSVWMSWSQILVRLITVALFLCFLSLCSCSVSVCISVKEARLSDCIVGLITLGFPPIPVQKRDLLMFDMGVLSVIDHHPAHLLK